MAKTGLADRIGQITDKVKEWTEYIYTGVWRDTRQTWHVKVLKTLSLSIRTFMSADLQSQACALTYRTLLALVPALALMVAIGRGFGLQNLLTEQLYKLFPAQHVMVEQVLSFVDSYLSQSSEGVFVGVGIVFLLWTLISLLSSVETSFNALWRVKKDRGFWRKVTDYLAILLILPVLMICIAGITVMMSTALKTLLPFEFMSGAIPVIIDGISVVLTWLFFAGAYMLIPNVRVRFVNALMSGVLVGTAFQLLQWVFMSGVMYVSKYNAIYGSFSFLPLFLIWLQLVWLFTLFGALLCYALQDNGEFDFTDDINSISLSYKRSVTIALAAIVVKRFAAGKPAMGIAGLSAEYNLPIGIVGEIAGELHSLGLISFVETDEEDSEPGLQPAVDISNLTVGKLVEKVEKFGSKDFIPDYSVNFSGVEKVASAITESMVKCGAETKLNEIEITK